MNTTEMLSANIQELTEDLYRANELITEQRLTIKALRKDVGFFRSCALSGELPTEGSEPSAKEL